jgi:hypothetical protein
VIVQDECHGMNFISTPLKTFAKQRVVQIARDARALGDALVEAHVELPGIWRNRSR